MKPAVITNHDLSINWWLKNYTRDALRQIAQKHRIVRGRDKFSTAQNIAWGVANRGGTVTFLITYPDNDVPAVKVCKG